MAKSNRKKMKILWAVDAFENKKVFKRALPAIRALSKGLDVEIEPIYILEPGLTDVDVIKPAQWLREGHAASKKALSRLFSGVKLQGLKSPTVKDTMSSRYMNSVQTLLAYARSTKKDLILVSSHAREGLARFFLGSFAENLLLHSEIPVFVVHPSVKVTSNFNRILFPTQFSDESYEAFKSAVDYAEKKGASITLFHQVPSRIEPVVGAGAAIFGGGWVPVRTYLETEEDAQHESLAKKWIRYAEKKGVSVRYKVGRKAQTTADAIVQASKSGKCGMIALASRSGPLSTAILGSVSRQVVRSSTVPVWVIHPKKKKKTSSGAVRRSSTKKSSSGVTLY